MLLLERGQHGRHRVDNARPVGTLGPQAPVAPQAPWTDRARSGMVGRLQACDPHKRPQRIVHREPLATDALGLGHAAGLSGLEPSCDLAPPRPHQDLALGVWQRPIADAMPRMNHLSDLRPPGRPNRLRRPSTRHHRFKIPQQMCPIHLLPACRIPRASTPVAYSRLAMVPRLNGLPHRSAMTSCVVRFDR